MDVVFAANLQPGMKVRRHLAVRGINRASFNYVADVLKQHTAVHILFDDGSKHRNVAPTDVYEVERPDPTVR